jgi:hypothetical protein
MRGSSHGDHIGKSNLTGLIDKQPVILLSVVVLGKKEGRPTYNVPVVSRILV